MAIGGETAKIFVIMNGSPGNAQEAFQSYVEYLEKSGIAVDKEASGAGQPLQSMTRSIKEHMYGDRALMYSARPN